MCLILHIKKRRSWNSSMAVHCLHRRKELQLRPCGDVVPPDSDCQGSGDALRPKRAERVTSPKT